MTQHAPSYTHEQKREFAREMRKNPTPAERQLWYHLRNKKLGYKFRRQAQIAGYIVDFYCPALRVVIEVDGSVHELVIVKERDAEKERILETRGLHVLRFLNEDVMSFISVVVARIKTTCDELRALKALSGANAGGGVCPDSSRVSCCGEPGWTSDEQHRLQRTMHANPVDASMQKPMTAEDIAAINQAWRKLVRRSSVPDVTSTADRANDQKLRLAEWLKKRAESAALTFKGIDVRQA